MKGRNVRAEENVSFLRKCLTWYVTPAWIRRRVRATRPKAPAGIERAFVKDEINKEQDRAKETSRKYRRALTRVKNELSFFDWLRFCKFINKSSARQREQLQQKKKNTFERLNIEQNGDQQLRYENIVNLADIELTEAEKDVLCRGLKFGIPPRIRREEILAEFELAWQQIPKELLTKEREQECRANLLGIAQRFTASKIDYTGFRLKHHHMTAIGQLKRNKNVIITRPDKGNGVVLLDREEYIHKMRVILEDQSKFEHIGSAEEHDRTVQHERALQSFLLRARRRGDIRQDVYERIRPVGSTRPRMYGVPKIHKPGTPLRPILSMINAPQHEMAKWLTEVLRPVLNKYSSHLLKDTFEFCEHVQHFSDAHGSNSTFMCSFDVTSLFTNVPLKETLQVCLDALYRDAEIPKPTIPEELLKKLLIKATTEVEFSFDGELYKQVDGVAMGSPLGPVLANIFMGHVESGIPEKELPLLYDRFVDDAFAIFSDDNEADKFCRLLNELHPSLKFTMESEQLGRLPFMDVRVMKIENQLRRSVYRKPTFTGLYTRWDSFCPMKHKTNLVRSLTNRAVKICSKTTLDEEIQSLRNIFRQNGYPTGVVDKIIASTIQQRAQEEATGKQATTTSDNLSVMMRLPWIGDISRKFKNEIEEVMIKACPSAKPIISFTTTHAFNGNHKDSLPATSRSQLVYKYKCCCGKQYVGKTIQVFSERIKQHVSNKLVEAKTVAARKIEANDSAVTKHLKESPDCLRSDPKSRFQVLAQARNKAHLDVLEAVYIRHLEPELCQQKDTFTRTLQLV